MIDTVNFRDRSHFPLWWNLGTGLKVDKMRQKGLSLKWTKKGGKYGNFNIDSKRTKRKVYTNIL